MNKRNAVLLLTQGIGALFFAAFWLSYALALPSNRVLHGEPIFHNSIQVLGGLFVALTAVLLVASGIWRIRSRN